MKNIILSISVLFLLTWAPPVLHARDPAPLHTIFYPDRSQDGIYLIPSSTITAPSEEKFFADRDEIYRGADRESAFKLVLSDCEIEVRGSLALENVILETHLTKTELESLFTIKEGGRLILKNSTIISSVTSVRAVSSLLLIEGALFIDESTIINKEPNSNFSVLRGAKNSSVFLNKINFTNSQASLINTEGSVCLNRSQFTEIELSAPPITILNKGLHFSPSLIIDNLFVNHSKLTRLIFAENVNEVVIQKVNYFFNKRFENSSLGGGFIRVINFNLTHISFCNFYSLKLINTALIDLKIRTFGENEQYLQIRPDLRHHSGGGFQRSPVFLGSIVIDSTIFDENEIINTDSNQIDDGVVVRFISLVRVTGRSSLLVRESNFFNNTLKSNTQVSNQENALCISTDERTESAYIEGSLFIKNSGKANLLLKDLKKIKFRSAFHAVSAVLLSAKSCSLVSTRFQSNKASTSREHYYKPSQTAFSCGYIHLNKVHFIANDATYGSTLYLKRSLEQRFDITLSSLIIESTIFSNNSAEAGQITVNSPKPLTITINSCRVTENRAHVRGGFLDVMTSHENIQMYVTGSVFFDNKADEGGVFFFGNVNAGMVTFSNCEFEGNQAEGNIGAGAVLSTNIIFDFYIVVRSCLFTKNYAKSKGGVFFFSGGIISIMESKFYDNIALSEGSIIAVESSASAQLMNCSIEGGNRSLFKIHDNEMNQLSIEGLTIRNVQSLHESLFKIEYIRVNIDHIRLENITAQRLMDISYSRSANLSQVFVSESEFDELIRLSESRNILISNVSVTKSNLSFLVLDSSEASLSSISLNLHKCPLGKQNYNTEAKNNKIQGCLIKASPKSSVSLANSQFFKQDQPHLIYICDDSALSLSKVIFYSSSHIIYASKSSVSISDSKFEKCEKALSLKQVTKIEIEKCEVDQSREFLSCSECSDVSLQSSDFKQSKGVIDVFSAANIAKTKTTIANCRFEKNSNYDNGSCLLQGKNICGGGAVSIVSSEVNVRDSKFYYNAALNFGGAIYLGLNHEPAAPVRWVLTNNEFHANTANEAGGAVFLIKNNLTASERNSFSENKAAIGRDISSNQIKMVLEEEIILNHIDTSNIFNPQFKPEIFRRSDELYLINNMAPGQRLPFPLIVSFRDQNGDFVKVNNINSIVLNKESDYLEVNSNHGLKFHYDDKNRYYLLVGLSFSAALESSQKVSIIITTNYEGSRRNSFGQLANEEVLSIYSITNPSPISIILNFRNCIKGEIRNNMKCNPCSLGTYSLNTEDLSCKSCPFAVICPGGDRFILKEGYWREAESSERIFSCKFPPACAGHSAVGDASCAQGYRGPMCQFCDVKNEYYQFASRECKSCNGSAFLFDVLKMVGFVSVFVCVLTLMLYFSKGHSKSTVYLICLKIVVSFAQSFMLLLSIEVDFISPELPNPLSVPGKLFTNLGSFLSPLACFSAFNKILGRDESFISAVIINFLYFFGILIIMLRDKFCKNPFSQSDGMTKFFLIFFFLTHFITLSTYFSYFQCERQSTAQPYIDYGSNYEPCWSPSYYRLIFLSLPIAVSILIIIPYVIVQRIIAEYQKASYIQDLESINDYKNSKFKRNKLVFQFFTVDFKPEHKFWWLGHILDGFLIILIWFFLSHASRDNWAAFFLTIFYGILAKYEGSKQIYVDEKLGKLRQLQKDALFFYSLYLFFKFSLSDAFWLPLILLIFVSFNVLSFVKVAVTLVAETIRTKEYRW